MLTNNNNVLSGHQIMLTNYNNGFIRTTKLCSGIITMVLSGQPNYVNEL